MKAKSKKSIEENLPKKKSLFDHVNHIRKIKDPEYYINLSEDDKKTFNHFMIVRALSMDNSLIEDMAQIYQIFDKIPSAQFYTLLIALVPKNNQFFPWIKSKKLSNNKELVGYVSTKFKVPTYQANDYVNLLIKSENGLVELVGICQSFGLSDKEVEKLFESKKED